VSKSEIQTTIIRLKAIKSSNLPK